MSIRPIAQLLLLSLAVGAPGIIYATTTTTSTTATSSTTSTTFDDSMVTPITKDEAKCITVKAKAGAKLFRSLVRAYARHDRDTARIPKEDVPARLDAVALRESLIQKAESKHEADWTKAEGKFTCADGATELEIRQSIIEAVLTFRDDVAFKCYGTGATCHGKCSANNPCMTVKCCGNVTVVPMPLSRRKDPSPAVLSQRAAVPHCGD